MTNSIHDLIAVSFPYLAYGIMGLIALRVSYLIATGIDCVNWLKTCCSGLLANKRMLSDSDVQSLTNKVTSRLRRLQHQLEVWEIASASMGLFFTTSGLLVHTFDVSNDMGVLGALGSAIGTTAIGSLAAGLGSVTRTILTYQERRILSLLQDELSVSSHSSSHSSPHYSAQEPWVRKTRLGRA